MVIDLKANFYLIRHNRILVKIAGEASFNPSGESIPLVSILVISHSGLGIEVSTIINRVVNPSSTNRLSHHLLHFRAVDYLRRFKYIIVSHLITSLPSVVGYGEKSWGTSSLLMLIDSTAYAALNQDEKMKINQGKVLVNRDPITRKIIIRVWTRNKQSPGELAEIDDQRYILNLNLYSSQ